MKRKGFTLIEMIGVVLLLGMLTLLILPTIINQVNSQKDEVSKTSLKLIYDATDLYVKEHFGEYEMIPNATYCISLETLVNHGQLKKPVKDLTTGKEIPLSQVVKVVVNEYEEGTYELVSPDECSQ